MEANSQLEDIMQGRFIKRTLQDAAKDMNLAQVKYMSGHRFRSADWISGRSSQASETALEYAQKLKFRFVDMKQISKCMKQYKKKSHPIYNKIMWGHYNNIVRELAYGYTDAVKEEMKSLEDNEPISVF